MCLILLFPFLLPFFKYVMQSWIINVHFIKQKNLNDDNVYEIYYKQFYNQKPKPKDVLNEIRNGFGAINERNLHLDYEK